MRRNIMQTLRFAFVICFVAGALAGCGPPPGVVRFIDTIVKIVSLSLIIIIVMFIVAIAGGTPPSASATPQADAFEWQQSLERQRLQELVSTEFLPRTQGYEHLLDPEFQRHLLWRHRRAYFTAFQGWLEGRELTLPPYPMSVPVEEWKQEGARVMHDPAIRAYIEANHPDELEVLETKLTLAAAAERVVVQPSVAHDHLAVMDSQLAQLNAINARTREMEERIHADPRLTEEEKREQLRWIRDMRQQRINELLKEPGDASRKDEVISPE